MVLHFATIKGAHLARTTDLASPFSAAAVGRLTALVRSRHEDLIKRRCIPQNNMGNIISQSNCVSSETNCPYNVFI